jgi:hypothetical protein
VGVHPDERLQQLENWNRRGVNSGQRYPRERLQQHNPGDYPGTNVQALTECRQLEDRRKRIYMNNEG